jgi:hypothetical protein
MTANTVGRALLQPPLVDLAEEERHAVMTEASTYASTKLMEIESRSQFVHEIHGDAGQTGH